MQAKMGQQRKHVRVGAHGGFPYNSGKLGLLANGNRYEVDSNNYFSSFRVFCPFILPCPNSDLFLERIQYFTSVVSGYIAKSSSRDLIHVEV